MDYKQLQSFLKVCEAGSINKAAEQLFVSQQALSKSMRNLEQELGVSLLVRTPGGVRPTPAGELLLQRAAAYLEEHDDILRQLRQIHTGPQLRVGFFMGLLQELPPHFFADFMDAHPEVQFHFHSYTDNENSRSYQNYGCDLVITTSPLTGGAFVELARLRTPIGVMLAKDHPLAARDPLLVRDLEGCPLITLNSENRSQTQLIKCLHAQGLAPDTVLGDADGELTNDLLRRGFVSFYAGKRSALPAGIVFRRVEDLALCWEFYIYGKRSRPPHPAGAGAGGAHFTGRDAGGDPAHHQACYPACSTSCQLW